MKREVALAVVIGAVAGLAGAWSARRDAAPTASASTAQVEAAEPAEAPVRPALASRAALRTDALHPLLRVQVKPAAAVEVRLSRWSLRAGKGSDGEWISLPAATTGSDGRLSLELPRGTYFVGARLASAQVELTTVADVELELAAGVPLDGRILESATGRPIANALVTAAPSDEAPEGEKLTTQTDGLGRFAFDAVPKGHLQLEASAAGYLPGNTNGTAPGSLDLGLDKSCRVDGVVIGGEGASVGGAREGAPATIAGEGGRFWLELDCNGAELIARDARGNIATARVAKGQRTVTLKLASGASLSGVVRSSDGALLEGAEVAAMTGDDEPRAHTLSDAQGAFTLSPLTPGSYIVRARKGRGSTAAVYGVDAPSLKPVELQLGVGAELEGEVIGADDPVEVELSWTALRSERPVKTHTLGGRFHFEDLPIGTARVKASAPVSSADRAVFLGAGSTQKVTLKLEPHGRIVGRVTGDGFAGARVTAWRRASETEGWRSGTAAHDGTFALEVPAGEYGLAASSKNGFAQKFDEHVTVTAGADAHIDLQLKSAGEAPWGKNASVARGETGASFENVSGSVQVSWLVADSPMSSAGVRVGDSVTAIDGKPVTTALDAFALARGAPGAKVSVTYRRDGSERTVEMAFAK